MKRFFCAVWIAQAAPVSPVATLAAQNQQWRRSLATVRERVSEHILARLFRAISSSGSAARVRDEASAKVILALTVTNVDEIDLVTAVGA